MSKRGRRLFVLSLIALFAPALPLASAAAEPEAAAAAAAPVPRPAFPKLSAFVYPYDSPPSAISDDGSAVMGLRNNAEDPGLIDIFVQDDGQEYSHTIAFPFGDEGESDGFGSFNTAHAVSNDGEVAGVLSTMQPVRFHEGTFTCLESLCSPSDYTAATIGDVNNVHQATGIGHTGGMVYDLAHPGSNTNLGLDIYPETINDLGLVGGTQLVPTPGGGYRRRPVLVGPGAYDACVLLPGRCRDLTSDPANRVVDVNDSGHALVQIMTRRGACALLCTYLVANGKAINIAPGVDFTTGVALSEEDIVVGVASDTGPYVWRKNRRAAIQDLVTTPDIVVVQALGITDTGQILAYVGVPGGYIALLTPDLVVNTTADLSDADPTDGRCSVVGAPGTCSLRAAIITANASDRPRTIAFNISQRSAAPTIRPIGALPAITKSGTTIDGETQPGLTVNASHVQLDGRSAGDDEAGLRLLGRNVTVKGFFVHSFQDVGIEVAGDGDHTVTRSAIGLNAAGAARSNRAGGIRVSSADNTIGGETFDDGNIVAGNGPPGAPTLDGDPGDGHGVEIVGPAATGNSVSHNAIGIDPGHEVVRPNHASGVLIRGASRNTVRSNVIAGNGTGVLVAGITGLAEDEHEAVDNAVFANAIGVANDPIEAVPNEVGVLVVGADNTIVGGAGADANVISGNTDTGVVVASTDGVHGAGTEIDSNVIGLDPDQTAVLANGVGIAVFAPETRVERNRIVGNEIGVGVLGAGSHGTFISHNVIGASHAGEAGLGNTADGVDLKGAFDVIVSNNTISGNGGDGIFAHPDDEGVPTTQLLIDDNHIGLDTTGAAALGNAGDGIALVGVNTAQVSNNRVSDNGMDGISVRASTAAGIPSLDVQILANRIGVDAGGTQARPNAEDGIDVEGSTTVAIGDVGLGNVIALNGSHAVEIGDGADQVTVRANLLGVDSTGSVYAANADGEVLVESGATNVEIGGPEVEHGNVVAVPLGQVALDIRADDTTVSLNLIGVALDDSDIGEPGDGVRIAADRTVVRGNIIRNTSNGVYVTSGRLNRFTFNSTFAVTNGYLLTPGTNDDIAAPSLIDALLDDDVLHVTGFFDGAPNTTYTLQFFASEATCTEAVGENLAFGRYPFQSENPQITTDADGHAVIDVALTDPDAVAGRSLTAVADDVADLLAPSNTSTHSNCQTL